MLKVSSLASVVFAFSVAACSALSDGAESDSDSLRINPEGTETMSTLIVALPTGSCLPGGSCSTPLSQQPGILLDSTAMTVGTPLRVRAGEHTLTVGGTSTTLNLVAGATRTMVVPIAKKVCTNATSTGLAETHFGKQPALRNAACPNVATIDSKPLTNPSFEAGNVQVFQSPNCSNAVLNMTRAASVCANVSTGWYIAYSYKGNNNQCVNLAVPQDTRALCDAYVTAGVSALGMGPNLANNIAVVPGSYGFPVESASGGTTNETRVLAEGDVKTLTFTLPLIGSVPDRFTTNLKFADTREMPDAVVGTITSACGNDYSIPATASGTVALKAFKFSECAYSLNVGGRSVALSQATTNNVNLYRVDVGDVTVTREDGSTYMARGTYEIYFGGNRVAGPYNTTTGIDLLNGAYEIVVKYNTAEGAKVNHYNITL